jgi:hypothetical protein
MAWQRVLVEMGPCSSSRVGAAGIACDCVKAFDADRWQSDIRWVAEAHMKPSRRCSG